MDIRTYFCRELKNCQSPLTNNFQNPSTNNSQSPSTNNSEVLNEDHLAERSLESTEGLVTIKKENVGVDEEDSDSGAIVIKPEALFKEKSEEDSKLNRNPEEKINFDKNDTKSFINDEEVPESILKTRRETILNNILSAFKFKKPTSTTAVNNLIMGSKNLDNYLEKKVGLGNWTADMIDREEIINLCDTSFILLQFYAADKDIDYKNTVKNVIDKIRNKMDDLEFDKMASWFYWTDFACRFVILLLAYEFLVSYESGNLVYRELINQLIPTAKPDEWKEMDYKRIIHFLGPKLVINYYYESDLYGYDDFDKIFRILKNKFEEVESKNLKSEVYNYDLLFQIYKCFDLN
ncbi:hypothetical protein KQX54_005144 [Cotesia glomerata]|uniref:Uncharacterized protein n=1 Tax=Cotesia glomerata TaxID=32391 RepID=A0AAV7HTV0_COTGL|nr:hypothetical protein KQX54_005144 [Cotesia glomerata]